MTKNIFISILTLCALGLFAMKVAQLKYDGQGNRLYSKSECIADLDQIVDLIKNTHPAPFDYISEDEFDKLHQAQIVQLREESTLREFHWNARKLIASIGCGHTSLTGQLEERKVADSMRFPLDTRFVGDQLLLINDSENYSELTSFTEILSINNQSAKEILYNLMPRVSSDGNNEAYPRFYINREVDFFIENHFGYPETYDLTILEDGKIKNVSIERGVRLWSDPADYINSLENLSFQLDKANDIAILTLRSFNYYRNDFSKFSEFVDSSMLRLRESNLNNLIIDIRGNGGGNPYCANHILKHISSSPYQYFHHDNMGYEDLKKEVVPFDESFKGKIYMIIDGGCGSTSGHLASLVKYNQPATLIGQTTGATYKCHDNSSNITLNKTGLNLHIARNTFRTTVEGMQVSEGVIPDIVIEKSLDSWVYEIDNVMDSIYQIISY